MIRSAVFVEMILRFHAEYGHCTVSAYNYDLEATYPGLAGWVRRIRRKRRVSVFVLKASLKNASFYISFVLFQRACITNSIEFVEETTVGE